MPNVNNLCYRSLLTCFLFKCSSLLIPEHVSSVKHQGQCNSSVAFATVGAIETCFSKVTGTLGNLSEQQLIDCGFGHRGANGCKGASLDSYLDWLVRSPVTLVTEETYPYTFTNPSLTCPGDLDKAPSPGAQIIKYFAPDNVTEDRLATLVVRHGAIIAGVATNNKFKDYEGGVFAGCVSGIGSYNHAVLVVGYGTTEKGEAYWLVKNSWGVRWGEEGFMRLKRGVNMCGIGRHIAVVECAPRDN